MKCWFKHDWGLWVSVKIVTKNYYNAQQLTDTWRFEQQRFCKRCGLSQRRP